MRLRNIIRVAADKIFPYIPVCVGCGVEKGVQGGLCPSCAVELKGLTAGETRIKEYAAWSAYRYDGVVKELVRRYKYGGQKWLGRFMGDAVFSAVLGAGKAVSGGQSTQRKEKHSIEKQSKHCAGGCVLRSGGETIACVCHVPLHKKRRAARGFDQAEVLARQVAERLHVPYIPALRRVRNTKTQTKLSEAQRRENIRGAFESAAGVSGNVMLIDDVLTTGATSAECARVLMDAGAGSVLIATFARSVYGMGEKPEHKTT